MPGRSSKTRSPEAVAAHSKRLADLKAAHQKRKGMTRDVAANAVRAVEQAIEGRMDGSASPDSDEGKNPHAVALGKLGGAKGGKARAEALSPTKRRAIARKAASARWKAR